MIPKINIDALLRLPCCKETVEKLSAESLEAASKALDKLKNVTSFTPFK